MQPPVLQLQPQIIYVVGQPQPQSQFVMINQQLYMVNTQSSQSQLHWFSNPSFPYSGEFTAVQANNEVQSQSENITQEEQATTPKITEPQSKRRKLSLETRTQYHLQFQAGTITKEALKAKGLTDRQISYLIKTEPKPHKPRKRLTLETRKQYHFQLKARTIKEEDLKARGLTDWQISHLKKTEPKPPKPHKPHKLHKLHKLHSRL
ncbi:hypothetical protein JQC92_21760 [Shewanella sp. 202IG2-18]|uniref:hypothetical protein n=1 Tax=Parashewanella hymeniacidonis TaxID=2807618 RepID=UPI001961185F|nr:hypothetical protein [Parashewanella hymeniacidonis]MBM7074607.1 hypothetical protein [Parashewanella hymeniacidonis]